MKTCDVTRRNALLVIILMGVVSLFADVTYEGARGIIPVYLTAILGAPVAVLGIVIGLGDFVGYGFRLVSGRLADVTRGYWALTIIGYLLNLLAVPLLAFSGSWQLAALLIIVERLGKAVRTPSRDFIISVVSKDFGRGKAFGIHEALDQIGAVAGPTIASLVLFTYNQYSMAFLLFSIPAALAILTLSAAYSFYKRQEIPSRRGDEARRTGLYRAYWVYTASITLSTAGFMSIAFILYRSHGVFPDWFIPIIFLLAQAVDALSGLLFGVLYDRYGLKIVSLAFPTAALVPIVALNVTPQTLLISASLFGIVLGAQETVQRAAVADLVDAEMRGTAYGIFNALFGLAWFIGGVVVGILYEVDFKLIIAYSTFLQVGATILMSKLIWK
ncbi:MAG: MFS transporter [Candidatus Bathyarchaeia archaeon]